MLERLYKTLLTDTRMVSLVQDQRRTAGRFERKAEKHVRDSKAR